MRVFLAAVIILVIVVAGLIVYSTRCTKSWTITPLPREKKLLVTIKMHGHDLQPCMVRNWIGLGGLVFFDPEELKQYKLKTKSGKAVINGKTLDEALKTFRVAIGVKTVTVRTAKT
ncbi:MAG: hypothetical protein Q7S37_03555 [bacterium]|nr:hypothetical protein [bacterium]